MIDLDLLQYRNLRLAAILSIGYGLGFFAMSLGLVLFLTQVWSYSVVQGGPARGPHRPAGRPRCRRSPGASPTAWGTG